MHGFILFHNNTYCTQSHTLRALPHACIHSFIHSFIFGGFKPTGSIHSNSIGCICIRKSRKKDNNKKIWKTIKIIIFLLHVKLHFVEIFTFFKQFYFLTKKIKIFIWTCAEWPIDRPEAAKQSSFFRMWNMRFSLLFYVNAIFM